MSNIRVAIAADHGGYDLKEDIKNFVIDGLNIEWIDLGAHSTESVDYPEFGYAMADAIANNKAEMGVLICGSGIGISIAANRHPSIRAALCTSSEMAQLSREHNNANVLALGARTTEKQVNLNCVETFLTTNFEGGRHQRRVDKLSEVHHGT